MGRFGTEAVNAYVARVQHENIMHALEIGEEHMARHHYGDTVVDAVIRADLEAQGLDFDAVCAEANGYERTPADALGGVWEQAEAIRRPQMLAVTPGVPDALSAR